MRHLTIKYPDHYNVVSFDKLDYCSSLNNARMLESKPNFSFFHGDVTRPGDVLKCLRIHSIDTIFHLAAHTHVDLSFGNSYTFTKNNVLGTHVLLESIKEYGGIQRFYHISTDEVALPAVNVRLMCRTHAEQQPRYMAKRLRRTWPSPALWTRRIHIQPAKQPQR